MTYYPRLLINLSALRHNADTIYNLLKKSSISLIAVTKGTTSHPKIIETISSSGISYFGDSRILNIKRARSFHPFLQYVLIRIPMLSEVEDVVVFTDMSLESEISTIKALSDMAVKYNKIHKIILMIDVGDRREGILPDDLMDVVNEAKDLKGVKIVGIGANFACFGGVIPDEKNLTLLSNLADDVSNLLGYRLEFVSGGSTSSIYLVEKRKIPKGINNLRVGTGILLGIDDIRDIKIKGTRTDTFYLEAEIVELKRKPSLPFGEIKKDAFGNIPYFKDKGIRKRGILALGRQDTFFSSLHPIDEGIEIVGGSSDHMIVDLTESYTDYRIGDIIKFRIDYTGILFSFNSFYVDKIFKEEVYE